jgi:hypothetical protein
MRLRAAIFEIHGCVAIAFRALRGNDWGLRGRIFWTLVARGQYAIGLRFRFGEILTG